MVRLRLIGVGAMGVFEPPQATTRQDASDSVVSVLME
jgi:hypothetical protein